MSLLPQGQKIPSSGGSYVTLEDGDNRFRIIQKPVAGYTAWSDGKTICKKTEEEFEGIDLDKPKYSGNPIKYFWAMVVWDYANERVKILKITQKQIMYALEQLDENEKWGGITKHDVNIIRGESSGKVSYAVIAEPGDLDSEAKERITSTKVDLSKIFTGENPFEFQKKQLNVRDGEPEDISIENVPF